MQCPRCASECHDVIRTTRNRTLDGKYSQYCDLRMYRCGNLRNGTSKNGCGKVFPVECRIAGVEVFNKGKLCSEIVELAVYLSKHLTQEISNILNPIRD